MKKLMFCVFSAHRCLRKPSFPGYTTLPIDASHVLAKTCGTARSLSLEPRLDRAAITMDIYRLRTIQDPFRAGRYGNRDRTHAAQQGRQLHHAGRRPLETATAHTQHRGRVPPPFLHAP